MWWCYYAFSISATGVLLNWSIIGVVLLTFLIHGSTTFTEGITLRKYPLYKEYQLCTSRLIPMWPKSRSKLDEALQTDDQNKKQQ